jgi:hypothetical protein
MVPHVIRLHAAWQEANEPAPAAGGCRAYTRSFHRPTGLQPEDRVWLVLDPALHAAGLCLNGQKLRESKAAGDPLAIDVTELIRARNELRLDDELWTRDALNGRRGALPEGMIWLEIRVVAVR